ncbi:MAG: PAS domain-containing protein, partial [Vicinamibacteria bacterium]
MDDYVGHLREFRRILGNLETQATHPLNRDTIVALTKKLDRDESQLNADRLERSIRATVEGTLSLEDLDSYEQDVLAIFHEITSKKRRELERERFRTLLDQSGESIFVIQPKSGRFLDVNQTAIRVLGYSKEELLELSLNHVEVALPLTPAPAWLDWVSSVRSAREVLYLEGVHRRKDGTRFEVEVSVGVASSDGQSHLLLVSRDVTARKRSEGRLRRQWAFFSRLVHRSVDGVMAFDRSFNVTYWNPAMERLLGERKNKVLGKNAFHVLPQLKELGEDRFFCDALAGTTSTSRNRAYTHAETARRVYFDGYYSPLTEDSGEILGGIGILRDVTERRETQLRQTRETMARMDEQRLQQL